MKRLFRNANIGLGVGVTLLVVGFAFLYKSEAALNALAVGSFAAFMGVFFALNIRDDRARRKGPRRSP
jgi:hypothetical protein